MIVEIVLGLVFVALVSVELFCGGINLPLRNSSAWGIEAAVLSPQFDLLEITGYHLVLLCLLFVFLLVRLERKAIPQSVFLFGLIVGIGGQACFPATQVVGLPYAINPTWSEALQYWINLSLGPLIGLGLGYVVALSYRNREGNRGELRRESIFGFVLIGLFMGPLFAFSVALTLLLWDALLAILGDVQGQLFLTSPIVKGFALTLLLILSWRFAVQFEFWPGPFSSQLTLGVNAIALVALSLLTGGIEITSASPASLNDSSSDVI